MSEEDNIQEAAAEVSSLRQVHDSAESEDAELEGALDFLAPQNRPKEKNSLSQLLEKAAAKQQMTMTEYSKKVRGLNAE